MGIGLNVAAPTFVNTAKKAEQTVKKGLIGVGKNNGVRVYQNVEKDGSKVLVSYKPGESKPFKTIIKSPEYTYSSVSDKYHTGVYSKSHEIRIKRKGQKDEQIINNMSEFHTLDGKPYSTSLHITNTDGDCIDRKIIHAPYNLDTMKIYKKPYDEFGRGNGAPVITYKNGVEVSRQSNAIDRRWP